MDGLYGGPVPIVGPAKRRGLVRYLSLEKIGDKPAELIPFHDRNLVTHTSGSQKNAPAEAGDSVRRPHRVGEVKRPAVIPSPADCPSARRSFRGP